MSKKYLIIEPYIYTSVNNGSALLYNTLDSKYFISNDSEVVELMKRLQNEEESYSIELSDIELKNEKCKTFFSFVKDNFMGDIYRNSSSEIKPMQLKPILNIQSDVELNRNEDGKLELPKILTYQTNITLILNDSNESLFSKIIKQISFVPEENLVCENELEYQLAKRTLESLKDTLYYINLTGVDVFKYYKFKELSKLLLSYNVFKVIHCNISHFVLNKSLIKELNLQSFGFIISISHEDFVKSDYEEALFCLKDMSANFEFSFMVRHEDEIDKIFSLIVDNKIEQYKINPYFDGNNIDFFKNNVFIEEEDILGEKKEMKQILSNEAINSFYFGRTMISPDGNVFVNPGGTKLGNLYNNSISEIVFNEMDDSKFWMLTRNKVLPCSKCVYCNLCPPISNYELAIGQFNLCHIHKNHQNN